MHTSESSTLSLPALRIHSQQPRPTPERVSAVAVGLLAIGFSAWVLLTLPLQAAVILTLASVLAWLAWMGAT